MKLSKLSLCNQIRYEEFINFYINQNNIDIINLDKNYKQEDPSYIFGNLLYECKNNMLSIPNNLFRVLTLSEKSYNNLKNYQVPKNIRIDVLKTLPNRFDIIQVSDTKCYKYVKTDNGIAVYVYTYTTKHTPPIHTFFFYINLNEGIVISDSKNSINGKIIKYKDNDTLIEQFYGDFMICITYLELTDVSFDICYSNNKRGHILKGNELKNELPFNIIQVNTNWNTTTLHIGHSFQVKGHWRLQPYGQGRTKYKYIFIDTFEKTGIIKKHAGKVIHN